MNVKNAFRLFPFLLYLMYVFMTPPVADDVWWRLHSGKEILAQGRIVDTNEWAYRDAGRAWVNHAAGYDVLLATFHRAFGMRGVVFLHFFVAFLLAALLLRPFRREDFAWALFLVPLLVVHDAIRPFLISDLFLYLAVVFAVRAHDANVLELRRIWPLYLLFWVWGWMHGAVWVGVAVFFLLSVRWRQLWRTPFAEMQRAAPLSLIVFCSLANPNFLSGLFLAWQYASGAAPWLSHLIEWQAPPPPALFFAGAWMAGFLWAWKRRHLSLSRLFPLAILLPSTFTQFRHLLLPAIAAGALLMTLDPVPFPCLEGFHRRKAALAALGTAMALVASLVHATRLQDVRFVPDGLYEQIALRCDIEGKKLRIFTHHAWGGSLIYYFGGRLQPYMDARNDCFSSETFARYDDIVHLRGTWYEKLMEDRPDGAVLRGDHPLVSELLRRGWISGVRWRYNRFLVAPQHGRSLCKQGSIVQQH